MNRILRALFIILFLSVGALTYGYVTNRNNIAMHELDRIQSFINAGPRFTAHDGKELCEYVNAIAKHSIGFQQSGLPMLDCSKYLRTGDKR
jgi:hypothetical protein